MMRLEAEGHDTVGLKFNDRWRVEKHSRLDDFMSGASHMLCVVDETDVDESWFAYIVGLARGRTMPLSLFVLVPGMSRAAWIEDLRLFTNLDEAVEYYAAESIVWSSKEERRMAKAALLELGISWHGESLAQCVREGDTKAVELFIASGFPPSVRDKAGVPMLCLAARFRHRAIVELLLDRGAGIDEQSDDRGYSPLMDAAQQGDEPLLELLLERGAATDLQSKDGQTALVLAVGRSDAAIVKKLLEHGANPDIADKLGLTARAYARLFHDPRIDEAFAVAV